MPIAPQVASPQTMFSNASRSTSRFLAPMLAQSEGGSLAEGPSKGSGRKRAAAAPVALAKLRPGVMLDSAQRADVLKCVEAGEALQRAKQAEVDALATAVQQYRALLGEGGGAGGAAPAENSGAKKSKR